MELTWIKDLANQEIGAEHSDSRDISMPNSEADLIEQGVIQFILNLRNDFSKASEYFNSYRPEAQIKVYRINNTVADFMLFRNGLKLIVANTAPSIVSIYFMSPLGGVFGANAKNQGQNIPGGHQLQARLGTFGDVKLYFHDDEIKPELILKHYLSHFIKLSSI